MPKKKKRRVTKKKTKRRGGGILPPFLSKSYVPKHWKLEWLKNGPKSQTRDYEPFPCGLGAGSGSVASWIAKRMILDRALSSENWIKCSKPVPHRF